MSAIYQVVSYGDRGQETKSFSVAKDMVFGWVVKGGGFAHKEEAESWIPIEWMDDSVLQQLLEMPLPNYFPPEFKKAIADLIEKKKKPADYVDDILRKCTEEEKAEATAEACKKMARLHDRVHLLEEILNVGPVINAVEQVVYALPYVTVIREVNGRWSAVSSPSNPVMCGISDVSLNEVADFILRKWW